MKNQILVAICSLLSLVIGPAFVIAQNTVQTSVKVTGEVITPLDLKLQDLLQFEQTAVVRKDKDGNNHTYTGVLLSAILQKAGVTLGKDLRGKNLTKYLLVEATDGYHVVFALAELDTDFTDRQIILATTIDGKPLTAEKARSALLCRTKKSPPAASDRLTV